VVIDAHNDEAAKPSFSDFVLDDTESSSTGLHPPVPQSGGPYPNTNRQQPVIESQQPAHTQPDPFPAFASH
jgi:hypothetical protein